ncbi:MAG: GNAT family N-acetyltransferase [Clostridiales bacterium]|nr:GNAT family N-acetyltransferase [Clostridiales bacterium]
MKSQGIFFYPIKPKQREILNNYSSIEIKKDFFVKSADITLDESKKKEIYSKLSDKNGYEKNTLLLIASKAERKIVGYFYYKNLANENHEIEVSLNIDDEYIENGCSTEIVQRLMSGYIFNAAFLQIRVDAENKALQKALEESGFSKISETQEEILFEKEAEKTTWLPIYMCLGISLGVAIGSANGNIARGTVIGVVVGSLLGYIFDLEEKKKHNREK